MKKATAIITARGGSKGVQKKNIRFVGGKPLIAFSIEAALACPLVDNCYVTTEDLEIMDISREYGAQVIERPKELAGDLSLSCDVVAHALQLLGKDKLPEHFVLLQPTSPLRTAKHLQECLSGFWASGAKCGVSVTSAEHHPWKMLVKREGEVHPFKDAKSLELPRQNLPEVLRINGAIYVLRSEEFLEKMSFFIEPAYAYTMDAASSLDVDSELDLKVLELMI
ncbi:acylneuraminate cytidylyltransferase family protein [bacterium]|nr:acylneuraminate cytidylyltransferase family protein [bacterium]